MVARKAGSRRGKRPLSIRARRDANGRGRAAKGIAELELLASRDGTLEWLSVEVIVALRRNPQYLTPAQMESLKASIRRDGFVAPVLVRPRPRGKFEVLSGNHRVMAARELGIARVPAIVRKMSDAQARRVAINLNTVHGDPPAELLAPFLAELDDDSLREIHLDDELLRDIVAFDSTLEARLKDLEPPPELDRASDASSIATHACPDCGRRHIKGNGAG